MSRFLILMVTGSLLTGCGLDPATGLVATGATAAAYSVTGKGPVDYTLSRVRHRDCDIRNVKEYGSYCIDQLPPPSAGDQDVYCYATLGTPDCSRQLDPYRNRNQPLDGSRLILTPPATPSCSGIGVAEDHSLSGNPGRGTGPVILAPVKKSTGPSPVQGPPQDPALQGS